jgi:hypothetical protein
VSERRPGPLVRLDGAVVPRLARGIRAVGTLGRLPARLTGAPGRSFGRWVRRNPTITVAVLTVVVAAILLDTTGGDSQHAVAPPPPPPTITLPNNVLGPVTGQDVPAYLAAAQQRRALLRTDSAAREVHAVVDFTGYLTPSAVSSVVGGLAGVQVVTAFAGVAPPATGQVHPITLAPGDDLASDLSVLKSQSSDVVTNYRKLVALQRTNPTPKYASLVAAYAARAQEARADATGIGATVGCVFAVVVTGPPAQLQRLASLTDVRVLDPAPVSVPNDKLMIVPLEPQATGVVPVLDFAGG